MTGGQALVLGVLQGLAEFLPISSSGHLVVVPWLMGWPEHGLDFDVALHLGTLCAVLYAFARDWWRLVASFLRGLRSGHPFGEAEGRLLGLLALASVPGGIAGLLLEHRAETAFRSPAVVAISMVLMGAVLLWADRTRGDADALRISVRDACLIGLAQALAIVPGVSRSGATISMALFLGYRREEAARFSFLLATPITFGAAALKVPHVLSSGDMGVALAGMAAAAAAGLASIRALLTYVRSRDYRPFVYYRFAFAAVVAGALLVRLRHLG